MIVPDVFRTCTSVTSPTVFVKECSTIIKFSNGSDSLSATRALTRLIFYTYDVWVIVRFVFWKRCEFVLYTVRGDRSPAEYSLPLPPGDSRVLTRLHIIFVVVVARTDENDDTRVFVFTVDFGERWRGNTWIIIKSKKKKKNKKSQQLITVNVSHRRLPRGRFEVRPTKVYLYVVIVRERSTRKRTGKPTRVVCTRVPAPAAPF